MQLKSKATSLRSTDSLASFLARLTAQRNEIQREAKSVEAGLKSAEQKEANEHAAQQSIKDASGWGGGNGVNSTVANAAIRWQAAADHASTLRANLAELREREQSLTGQSRLPPGQRHCVTVFVQVRNGLSRLAPMWRRIPRAPRKCGKCLSRSSGRSKCSPPRQPRRPPPLARSFPLLLWRSCMQKQPSRVRQRLLPLARRHSHKMTSPTCARNLTICGTICALHFGLQPPSKRKQRLNPSG